MEAVTDIVAILGVSSPYLVVFVLLTIGIWVFPFAEEVALITAGYMLYRGEVSWWLIVPVAGVGMFLGDGALFWIGRQCQWRLLSRFVPSRRYARVSRTVSLLCQRYGVLAVFCARFLPGVRFPMHVMAGASGMAVASYVAISCLSILCYVPLLVMFTYTYGEEIAGALQSLHHFGDATWVVLFLTTGLWLMCRPWMRPRAVEHSSQGYDFLRSPLPRAPLHTESPKERG